MRNFPLYFGKELYTFRTDLLSIIRIPNTLFTATGICHTSMKMPVAVNTVLRILMVDRKSVRNM